MPRPKNADDRIGRKLYNFRWNGVTFEELTATIVSVGNNAHEKILLQDGSIKNRSYCKISFHESRIDAAISVVNSTNSMLCGGWDRFTHEYRKPKLSFLPAMKAAIETL